MSSIFATISYLILAGPQTCIAPPNFDVTVSPTTYSPTSPTAPTSDPTETPTPSTSVSINDTNMECQDNTFLGNDFSSPSECAMTAADTSECTVKQQIIWTSMFTSSWGCRCCNSGDDFLYYAYSNWWELYDYTVSGTFYRVSHLNGIWVDVCDLRVCVVCVVLSHHRYLCWVLTLVELQSTYMV